MKWFEQTKQSWITAEINKIKTTAHVTIDEAKNILEQRLIDIATSHQISKEEAVNVYGKLRSNPKTKAI